MSNNIFTVYGEVPELVEKKTKEIVNDYLGQEIDDFNYVKYNFVREWPNSDYWRDTYYAFFFG